MRDGARMMRVNSDRGAHWTWFGKKKRFGEHNERERGGREDEGNNKRKEIKREREERGYFGLNGEFIYKRSAFRSIRRSNFF